jgi:predicted  nucleic acid-binding Zn-ribbon protein
MAEISLRIHAEGNESHEITTPDDIISAEFISELLRGLRLSETGSDGKPILWEIYNKDIGRNLIRAGTLLENGVLDGHDLYLRRAVLPTGPPFRDDEPVLKPPIPPPPRKEKPGWPLWLVLSLVLVAGLAGYFAAANQTDAIREALRNAQAQIDAASKKEAAATTRATQLEQELQQLRRDSIDKDAVISKLQTDAPSKDAQIAALNRRVLQVTGQHTEMQADTVHKQEQIKDLEASVQKLRGQAATLQQAIDTERQRSQLLQQATQSLQLQIQTERNKQQTDPNKQRFGFLVWTGNAGKNVVAINGTRANIGSLTGSLPGVECKVQAADPSHVTITELPNQLNGWSHVAFAVKGNGATTVTLIWSVK